MITLWILFNESLSRYLLKLAVYWWASCFGLLDDDITSVHHHNQFTNTLFEAHFWRWLEDYFHLTTVLVKKNQCFLMYSGNLFSLPISFRKSHNQRIPLSQISRWKLPVCQLEIPTNPKSLPLPYFVLCPRSSQETTAFPYH